ncbi:MAG: cytochrome c oxidase subunit 3 family protein [Candidatus Polarisedimenticolaceae bacterium]|nr:cytochrome c oxidase subunit 3 family protein [Candidatus Polarisedimenticolaceae bacterium]
MTDLVTSYGNKVELDNSFRWLSRENGIPGNPAIWVGILAEMTEFALMFGILFIAKVHNPEVFSAGPAQLNTTAGVLNTLALLSSSYFVARAMAAIRADRCRDAVNWLWLAILAACIYLGVKSWEYYWNSTHGISTETNLFFTIYYYVTFNHFLHVMWGGGALLWGIARIKAGGYTAKNHEGLEVIASYWHMVDLVWIIIFPLLYVLH